MGGVSVLIFKVLSGVVGALLLAYIGYKLLQIKVKSIALTYSIFVALYVFLLIWGNVVPILAYIAGELVVIWLIVRFMGF
jgi:ABC-type siderophore export system fused ATPase/permease subunit